MIDINTLPRSIYSGAYQTGHVQGIAIDTARKYMYFSFTTCLIKTDLAGNVIGSVKGLLGHLGCIQFNDADGRVWGSLEYKNDGIGQGILKRAGQTAPITNAFYAAIFDVDKITRMDMDAETDGIMTAVYLKEVVDDYLAEWDTPDGTVKHRYGCSGIDGLTIGPLPGAAPDTKKYLYVAYGVYGDVNRADNDHQVILRYDHTNWAEYERPISQSAMHTCGPDAPDSKYFVFTGNTTYGIQNLDYDPYTGNFFAAVYPGKKEAFPNYTLFAIDGGRAPERKPLAGLAEEGETLSLTGDGWFFPHGDTGFISLGDGYYYISHHGHTEAGWDSTVRLYRWDGSSPLKLVED